MAQYGIPIYNVPLLREWRGLTQAQLAQATQCSPSTVAQWERGAFRPMPRRVRRLAHVLGVSEAVLRTPDPLVALTTARICDTTERRPDQAVRWTRLMRRLQQRATAREPL